MTREERFNAYLDKMEKYINELMLDCVDIEYPQHGIIWSSLGIALLSEGAYENSDVLAELLIKFTALRYPNRTAATKYLLGLQNNP